MPDTIDHSDQAPTAVGREHVLSRELQALRNSEAAFRDYLETAAVCLHWVAADGTILWANQAALDLLGYPADAFVGRNIGEFHADEKVIDTFLHGLQAGVSFRDYAARLRHRDGSIRHVLINSSVLFEDGQFVHARCFTRDVTALYEEKDARLLLAAIVNSSDDAIISKDLNGVITSWNMGAERLFGYTASEAIGRTVAELLIPEDRQDEEPDILMRLRRGERVDHFETVRRCRDGRLIDLSLTISPVRDSGGRIIGASKIARDITARKRADAELRRANKDLEQFAFSASHDLREPLRTIRIYSRLLVDRYGPTVEGEPARFLDFLQGAAARMDTLIDDLLSYLEVTTLESVERIDANLVLSEVLANLGGAIDDSGAVVTYTVLPMLRLHSTHLRLLFQNLIGNAIKYQSPERRPTVDVSVERRGAATVFTVADNGIGIEPQYKEQIFGLFSRLHSADRYEGTGIGLAICQRAVERYGGRIWVDSEPGCGSSFHFAIPD